MNILNKTKVNMMWNRGVLVCLLTALIFILYFLMKSLGGQESYLPRSVSIPPIKVDVINASRTKPIFRVYYPVNNKRLASSLGKEIAKRLEGLEEYSAVEVTYYLGVSDKTMMLQKGTFDLFLVKPDFEKSLPTGVGNNRKPLASYAGYGVYLISKNDMPKLEASYLHGKSLGLSADPFSESAYKVPREVILRSIKKESLPNFVNKYATHADLRKGLLKGEVDLIASYWDEIRRKDYPQWQALRIGYVPKGQTWFYDSKDHILSLACVITEALKNNARKRTGKYWNKISDLSGCNETHE